MKVVNIIVLNIKTAPAIYTGAAMKYTIGF